MKEIGYTSVQLSGICAMDPYVLKEISEQTGLPVACTHSSFDRIVNDTDKLIEEHKIYGCPVIGISSMPNEYRSSVASAREFLKVIDEPMKKINAAGLKFAYHNHAFELEELEDGRIIEMLVNEAPELNFILDTYWLKYGGYDPMEFISRVGGERMSCIHFKDMKSEPKGAICPCGEGVIDFAPIASLCRSIGIKHVLVEQDNAPDSGDSYGQMAISYNNLKHLF